MPNWPQILGVLGTAAVLFLYSVPFVTIDPSVADPVDPDFCTSQHKADEAGCKADHDHDCVWCVSRAVKPACYNAEVAKQLPHSVFTCEAGAEKVTELEVE